MTCREKARLAGTLLAGGRSVGKNHCRGEEKRSQTEPNQIAPITSGMLRDSPDRRRQSNELARRLLRTRMAHARASDEFRQRYELCNPTVPRPRY